MITRSSLNWKEVPGNFDKLNTFNLFPSSNEWGIPDLKPQDLYPPKYLIPYTQRIRAKAGYTGAAIQFFTDDYRFETLWNRPIDTLSRIKTVGYALSPDFSIYNDYPLPLQLFNVYRSRWLARLWQEHSVRVIPTIGWTNNPDLLDLYLAGITENSPIAISTLGIQDSSAFLNQLDSVIQHIKPQFIICYGEKHNLPYSNVYYYNTFWQQKRESLKKTNLTKSLDIHAC
jgi:hypothetical protein